MKRLFHFTILISFLLLSYFIVSTTIFAQYKPSIPNAVYDGANLIIDCVSCGPSSETTQTLNWSASGSGGTSVTGVTSSWNSEYEMHKITISDAIGKNIVTGSYVQVCASTGCSDMRRINALSTNVTGYDRSKPEAITTAPFGCALVLSSNNQEIADSSKSDKSTISLPIGATIVDATLLVTVPSGQSLPDRLPVIDFGGNPDDTTNRLTMGIGAGGNKFEIKGKKLDITGYTLITVDYPFCTPKPTIYVLPGTPTSVAAVQATVTGTTWGSDNRDELIVTGTNLGDSWRLYSNPGGSEDLDVEITVSSWSFESAKVLVSANSGKYLDTGNYLRVCKDRKTSCSGYIKISERPAFSTGNCVNPNCEYTVKVQISSAYNREEEARNAITSGEWDTKSTTYFVQEPKSQQPGSILAFSTSASFSGRVYWDRQQAIQTWGGDGNSLCVRYISNKPDRWHLVCKPLTTQAGGQNPAPNNGGQQNTNPSASSSNCPLGSEWNQKCGRCVILAGDYGVEEACEGRGYTCINQLPVCKPKP